MTVRKNDLMNAIQQLGIDQQVVCLHTSLKSFGFVEGGGPAIVDAFLESGCTVLSTTHSYEYQLAYQDDSILHNGYDEDTDEDDPDADVPIFDVQSNDLSIYAMGHVPAAILQHPERIRGNHPVNSFAAVGPRAHAVISSQTLVDVFAPLRAVYEADGYVLLMGVDLRKMTAIHFAEQLAGRKPFIRWAKDADGQRIPINVGSCSDGFNNLQNALAPIETQLKVGNSLWRLYPMRELVERCIVAININPQITHCPDPTCIRCADAIHGGPVVPSSPE